MCMRVFVAETIMTFSQNNLKRELKNTKTGKTSLKPLLINETMNTWHSVWLPLGTLNYLALQTKNARFTFSISVPASNQRCQHNSRPCTWQPCFNEYTQPETNKRTNQLLSCKVFINVVFELKKIGRVDGGTGWLQGDRRRMSFVDDQSGSILGVDGDSWWEHNWQSGNCNLERTNKWKVIGQSKRIGQAGEQRVLSGRVVQFFRIIKDLIKINQNINVNHNQHAMPRAIRGFKKTCRGFQIVK